MEKQHTKQRYEVFISSKSERNIALYKKLKYKILSQRQVTEELKFVVYGESKIMLIKEKLHMRNVDICNCYIEEWI